MSRRIPVTLVAAAALVVLAAGSVLPRPASPRPRMTAAAFVRVRDGMTRAQVEVALRRTSGDLRTEDSWERHISFKRPTPSEDWIDDVGRISVWYDAAGRVTETEYARQANTHRRQSVPEHILDYVTDALGL